MGKMNLILSDIDGTILDSCHQVDKQLKEVVGQLEKQGIPFCLASARSPWGISPIADSLALTSPIAAYNGALIFRGQPQEMEVLDQLPIVAEEAAQLLELLERDYPHISICLYSNEELRVKAIDQWVELETSITGEEAVVTDFSNFLEEKHPVHKCLLIGEDEEIAQLLVDLRAATFTETAFYLSKSNYLEVTHKEVSKERALRVLAEHFQVGLDETVAFGDHFNDVPMLQAAGCGVAMGNAPEEVKNAADVVTTSNQEHGVARFLRQQFHLEAR